MNYPSQQNIISTSTNSVSTKNLSESTNHLQSKEAPYSNSNATLHEKENFNPNKSQGGLSSIVCDQLSNVNEISKAIYNDAEMNQSIQNMIIIPPSKTNAQIPFEYINEIWGSLIEKEYLNNYNYNAILSIQKDINPKMRAILIDWLVSVHSQLHLKQPTLFLTVNIIDRYITNKEILRSKFQLLGITSLFIACKYEEISFPHISYFVECTAKTYTKQEILEMESEILNVLNFELNLPSCISFYEIISLIYEFNKEEYRIGCFMLELYLLDAKCNKYNQSHIALAVCYIILKLRDDFAGINDKSTSTSFIWNEIDIIKDCAKDIYYYLENKNKIKYKAVFEKYSM